MMPDPLTGEVGKELLFFSETYRFKSQPFHFLRDLQLLPVIARLFHR